MLLKQTGQAYEHNGMSLEVGSGKDKETHNRSVDVHCCFFPPVNKDLEKKIEKRMSAYYGAPVRFDDLAIDLVIMVPEMLRPAKKCRVYQLTDKGCQFRFRSYEHVKALGLTAPPESLYHVVYDGYLHTEDPEEIFYILNCRHPEGYKGWSLSTSDIIELYDAVQSVFYYCDSFCFQEVPFEPPEKGNRHA